MYKGPDLLTGTARLLAEAYNRNREELTALLVLCDRLEEMPDEVSGAEPEAVRKAAQWFRSHAKTE